MGRLITWVPDVKNWRKFWSVKLALAGGFLLTLAEQGPAHLAWAWDKFPIEFQDAVPDSVIKWIGLTLVFLSPIARVIKQKKLHE